jgi:hypothetical protein
MGMGGVHSIPQIDGTIKPYLWRAPFPSKITRPMVSTDNPGGRINNSDLEFAGAVGQHDILCRLADVAEVTVHNCYDNTATTTLIRCFGNGRDRPQQWARRPICSASKRYTSDTIDMHPHMTISLVAST